MKFLLFGVIILGGVVLVLWQKQRKLQSALQALFDEEAHALLNHELLRVNERISEEEYQTLCQKTREQYENARQRLLKR